MKYNRDDLNALKFKAQMVEIYIQSLFPKKFFSTYIDYGSVDYWISQIDMTTKKTQYYYGYHNENPYIKIAFKYLRSLVSFDQFILLEDLDKEIEDLHINADFKLSELKDICTYRNNICKIINVPSKCSVSPLFESNSYNDDRDLHSNHKYQNVGVITMKNNVGLEIKKNSVSVILTFSSRHKAILGIENVKHTFNIPDYKNVSLETLTAITNSANAAKKINVANMVKEFRTNAENTFRNVISNNNKSNFVF